MPIKLILSSPYDEGMRFLLADLINGFNNLPANPNTILLANGPTVTLDWPISEGGVGALAALLNYLNNLPETANTVILGAVVAPAVPPATPATGADPNFPPDPANAPTSPLGAEILVEGTTIGGKPYLKDGAGRVYTIAFDAAGVPQVLVNSSSQAPTWTGHANGPPSQLIADAGGVVKVILTTGIAQTLQSNGSWYTTTPPSIGNTGTATTPALPPLPTPSAIAPGSSGRTILCGTGLTLATLSAAIPTAQAGDTVLLSLGNYTDTPAAWTVPLLIDLGGSTFDATGKTAGLARGKALLCPAADSIIQNGTITGVAMDQTEGQLTSAIRPDAGCGYLTIKSVAMHDCQCAVGEGGTGGTVIDLNGCDISNNGLKTNTGALTHDLYVGADCRRLTLTNVVANGAIEGHAIKCRGPELIVNGGTFASAPGKPFDIPNGSTAPFRITGATILKGPNDPDHGILAYGEEGPTNGLAGGTINGGAITAACPNPTISGPGGTITLVGVALSGNPIAPSGGIAVSGT